MRRVGSRILGIVGLLVVGFVSPLAAVVGVPAGSATATQSCTFTLSTNVAVPGQTVTAFGQGYVPGHPVPIIFQSDLVQVATATPNAQGSFTVPFVVPAHAALGAHTLLADGRTLCDPADPAYPPLQVATAPQVAVVPVVPAAPTKPLPFTGTNAFAMLLGALALILLGSTTVLASRRRRHRRIA